MSERDSLTREGMTNGRRVWVAGPPLEAYSTVEVRRLLYDPTRACPLGHIGVKPYPPYHDVWGTVQRYYCPTCKRTYTDPIKPKQAVETAIIIGHYFAHVSCRRFPIVFQFICKAVQLEQNAVLTVPSMEHAIVSSTTLGKTHRTYLSCSESTVKRVTGKYSALATPISADEITRLFRPKLSGYFGIDGFFIATIDGLRVCLVAHDLVMGDLVSVFFTSFQERLETEENCRVFVRRFLKTVRDIGADIIQVVLDDREELWKACRAELPPDVILTLDVDHFMRKIDVKKLPEKYRTAKSRAMIAAIEFALRYSSSEDEAREILGYVREARNHWLEEEGHRAQAGIRQILNSLNEMNISRLLSFFSVIRKGRRLHFRSSNRTEGAIGVLSAAFDSLNCLQANEQGQVNLIVLIARLMPSTRDGKSSLQRGRVNRTLGDLMRILQMFNPNSPIQ